MANSGWTADPDSITLPPGASDGDVYIYIGPDDPIAEALTQLAALVFYWNVDSAFLMTVERSFVGTTGGFHLYGTDPFHPLVQFIDIYTEGFPAGKSYLTLGQTTDTVSLYSWGDLAIESGGDFDKSQDQKTLSIQFIEDDGTTDPDTELYGRSMARGLRGRASLVANSAAVLAETAMLAVPARDYRANRAYQITVSGRWLVSVATNHALWKVRKTNTAGQILANFDRTTTSTTNANNLTLTGATFVVGPTADVNASIVLTLAANAGTATMLGAADMPRLIEIRDVGHADDYPNSPELV